MAVTSLPKPGDFSATFTLTNTVTTPDQLLYGVMANGKIYRARLRNDALTPFAGGRGTWVDTGLTIPDVSTVADL